MVNVGLYGFRLCCSSRGKQEARDVIKSSRSSKAFDCQASATFGMDGSLKFVGSHNDSCANEPRLSIQNLRQKPLFLKLLESPEKRSQKVSEEKKKNISLTQKDLRLLASDSKQGMQKFPPLL